MEFVGELPFGIGGKDVILYTMGVYVCRLRRFHMCCYERNCSARDLLLS